LARVEERLVTVFNRQTNIEDKVNAIESKVDELTANMISSKLLERFIWVIVVASVGAIFTYMG
jgi:hypothetical protein